jgi:hypothetical protein
VYVCMYVCRKIQISYTEKSKTRDLVGCLRDVMCGECIVPMYTSKMYVARFLGEEDR